MKRIRKKLAALLSVFLILLASCEDFSDLLEKEETGDMDLRSVFSDIRTAEQVLSNLYDRVHFYMNTVSVNENGKLKQGALADTYSAFGATALDAGQQFTAVFNRGEWSESFRYTSNNAGYPNGMGDFIRFDYAAIRACMLFLENIEKVPFDAEYGYGENERNQKIGEAKFLAAFFHMDLLKNYGGMIIVDRVLSTTDPEVTGKRNTYDEFVEHIVKLCDEAAEVLPLEWASGQTGRVTKGAAMTLKTQALLFAASPLANNPDRPEASPFRGKYDPDKWKLAAQAAADVIQLNQYALVDDITQLFITFTNKEVIFSRMSIPHFRWDYLNLPPYFGWNSTGAGKNQLTYNLMKYYKIIKDGKAYDQDDPENAGGFDLQNPFVNLDPRFYRDVAYNGANLRQGRIQKTWVLGENTSSGDAAKQLSQYNTYLYCIKQCNLDINPLKSMAGGTSHHNFIFLRYADVLLMYAEAMNEAYGPDIDALGIGLTATQAINKIRERTKCMPYPEFMGNTYSMALLESGLSPSVMRKEIRQERIVEMNFEDHIFYDIRRWKVPVESQKTAYFLKPVLSRDVPGGSTKITYVLEEQVRAFESSWYLLPMPNEEIQKNPDLVQNPGWPGSPEADNL